MTYRELFYKATRLINNSEITLGEYEEMTKPLDREVEQSIPHIEYHIVTIEDLKSAYLRGRQEGSKDLMKLYSKMELCLNLVHDIALICKESKYPEDLEDIYDLLTNNGIDYKNLEDNTRWLEEHD